MGAMTNPRTTTLTRRVEWIDTDASGHQHNSLIMRLVEAAERRLIADAGVLGDYFWSAPRVRQEIDFTGKLYFDQEVSTTVTLTKLGRSSITFTFEVWGEAHGETPRRCAASGLVVAAHVPQGTDRATPWPDHIVAALATDAAPIPHPH